MAASSLQSHEDSSEEYQDTEHSEKENRRKTTEVVENHYKRAGYKRSRSVCTMFWCSFLLWWFELSSWLATSRGDISHAFNWPLSLVMLIVLVDWAILWGQSLVVCSQWPRQGLQTAIELPASPLPLSPSRSPQQWPAHCRTPQAKCLPKLSRAGYHIPS